MTSGRPSEPYRADLDGLRALAVLPVCLFHAGARPFSGGFVGVDVFFVISGYLMARTIGRELAAGEFSLAAFYERRARRILPALFVLLGLCLLVAAFIVPPKLFRDLGGAVVAALLFSSNIRGWWQSANYFDAPSDWNPLLHTWSLALEEQFYLLFPLFLGVVWRFTWPARTRLLGLAFATSLGLGIWATDHAPTAGFYLLPPRAWELLAGALLALQELRSPAPGESSPRARTAADLACALGLALLLGSLLGFDREMPFPGLLAIIPCLGAVLLLHFGRDAASLGARLLAVPPLPFIGKISYSLYLWHWPWLVFGLKYGPPWLGGSARWVVLGAALPMAWLSWRWVEQPLRSTGGTWTRTQFGVAAALATAALGLAGALTVRSAGWQARFPGFAAVSIEPQLALESAEPGAAELEARQCFVTQASEWRGDACFLTRGAEQNALLWGDSFAAHYADGFVHAPSSGLNVLEYASPQCPPIIGYRAASRPQCAAINLAVPAILARYRISTVILAAHWSSYFRRRKLEEADLGRTVAFLRHAGLRVVLVGQSPVFSFAYPDEFFFARLGRARGEASFDAPVDLDPGLNPRLAAVANADVFFDPLPLWCQGSLCRFKQGPSYLFVDDRHYSHFGSRIAVRGLLARIAASN